METNRRTQESTWKGKKERTGKGTILGKRERNHKRERKGNNKGGRGRETQEGKGSALDEEMKQEAIAGDRPRPAGGRGPDGVQQK
jgi:hypothetical protein